MKKEKVANGVFWLEIPEADLRILCGCPADTVKHLIRRGLIHPAEKESVRYETGPNAILLSDTPIQKGSFANLAEFPLLQMFYRQGTLIPGHPNNTGRKPLLVGLGDQVRSQGEYVFRGNYGLASQGEIEAAGVDPAEAREMMEIKKWFSFGTIRATSELVDMRPVDADAVELAPGCVVHRKGFNRYEFIASRESLEVDLSLGTGEEYEPAYTLPSRGARRNAFSVIHIGEGDGWDATRPCMGSIVCGGGLYYLVDAGPHITRSLDALGLEPSELEGIFHTHSHDDHFAGLTSLVRADRRLKYYAVPYVRASVQKKLSALMRIDEERFSRFFDVHDLVPGEWNSVGALEVKPLYSPHPVETTVFFFRSGTGNDRRTYAHLADMPSLDVLSRLAASEGRPAAMSEAHRAAFQREVSTPVDVKKIDAGGGLIHGNSEDFRADESKRILLSHGVPESRGDHSDRVTTVGFGESDVLIPGVQADYYWQTARACLSSWFPRCPSDEIERLARCPTVDIPAGGSVYFPDALVHDVRLIVRGGAEETDPATGVSRRLGVGAFAGGYPRREATTASRPCRARTDVTVVSIPARTYRDFIERNGGTGVGGEPSVFRDVISACPAFSGIRTESVLNAIAASLTEKRLEAGSVVPPEPGKALLVLARGELDIAVGSQLVETLHPGGFWGEERIVSSAPNLSLARAVSECTYLVVPADVLEDVPIVQWELLETFGRRLRSFRAGFRFEWSPAFLVNVKSLDDQHRTLFSSVNALSEAIGKTGIVGGHEREKREVLEFTRTHFADEEELMKKHAYPHYETQKIAHAQLLEQLERLVNAEERRARPRLETAVDYLKDWLIAHTLLEDLQYREFFAQRGIT